MLFLGVATLIGSDRSFFMSQIQICHPCAICFQLRTRLCRIFRRQKTTDEKWTERHSGTFTVVQIFASRKKNDDDNVVRNEYDQLKKHWKFPDILHHSRSSRRCHCQFAEWKRDYWPIPKIAKLKTICLSWNYFRSMLKLVCKCLENMISSVCILHVIRKMRSRAHRSFISHVCMCVVWLYSVDFDNCIVISAAKKSSIERFLFFSFLVLRQSSETTCVLSCQSIDLGVCNSCEEICMRERHRSHRIIDSLINGHFSFLFCIFLGRKNQRLFPSLGAYIV